MGFTRRYNYFPTQQQITQIEGVIIADLPQPGTIGGVGTGTACCVGEFADVTNSVNPDGSGGLATKYRPTQIFGTTDAVQKFGGFDPTLGDFGITGGNGYVDAFKSKQWSALVCVAVNIASAKAARVFRALPTNKAAANPIPAVAMQGVTIPASTEFTTGAGARVRLAGPVAFTDTPAYATGTDGSLATAGSAASQTFTSASLNALLLAKSVKIGDILVMGVVADATYGVAGIMGAYFGTFRVLTTPASGTTITIEQLDGSSWAIPTQATIPWRLHTAATADSAAGGSASNPGVTYATASGYTVPARPLDSTIATSSIVSPTVPPPAPTASSWDPQSALTLITHSAGSLVFTSALQAPNVGQSATMDSAYSTAIDSLLTDDIPAANVNILWTSRTSATIRAKGNAHASQAAARGVGRVFISSPDLAQQTVTAVTAAADPGVAANRSERVFYTWPGTQLYVNEAVNTAVATAIAGKTTVDGMIDVRMDGFLASILSVLAPERNPGQTAPPVGGTGGVLSVLSAFQRGVSGLTIDDYVFLRSQGIAALHFDGTVGPEIMSGVTSSLLSGTTNINRRRFADFIEDSLANALMPFSKLPVNKTLVDQANGEIDNFLQDMLAPSNPPAQRIAGYAVDAKSGNTFSQLAAGIFVIKVSVQMLPTADFIVLQAAVGPTVVIQATVGGGVVNTQQLS